MPPESSESEVVRWRAWPCPECTGGATWLDFLIGRHGTSAEIPPGSEDELIEHFTGLERRWLCEYVAVCRHTMEEDLRLPKLDEGSEHRVYLAPDRQWVIKVTRSGTYGDSYFLRGGLVHQRCQTPVEYLLRVQMVDANFGLPWTAIGVTQSGQIVTRQQSVKGEPPTQKEVDEFLLAAGIEPVKQSCWLWRQRDPEKKMDYWIGDARADNFVKTANGIVPIDLRMWGVVNDEADEG